MAWIVHKVVNRMINTWDHYTGLLSYIKDKMDWSYADSISAFSMPKKEDVDKKMVMSQNCSHHLKLYLRGNER